MNTNARARSLVAICAFAIAIASAPAAYAHGRHVPSPAEGSSAPATVSSDLPVPKDARWLAGDHHVHSRFSVGYDAKTTPPTPIMGADAAYPIPMNAVMARRHGLSWMVSTDHGGPLHSKVNHDHAYPELLSSRAAVPDLVQFFGMEFDSPAADHSSIVVPAGPDEAARLRSIEEAFNAREAFPSDPARDTEPRMVEALKAMDAQRPKPVLFAHHPSRSATALGQYGATTPAELRNWNDAAPEVAIGMEGAPGHQAAAQMRQRFGASAHAAFFKGRPRGAYGKFPTMGGYDQMTARVGGFWDSMLGEGRRWWITANSDSHIHWTDGGADFWPGEYSKTYVLAEATHDSILASMRSGRIFVTTGDLVSRVDFSAHAGSSSAITGGSLAFEKGKDIVLKIRLRDPSGTNANGDNPVLSRVDVILGRVKQPLADRSVDSNPTTSVVARFTAANWTRDGEDIVIEHKIPGLSGDAYVRVRGTNTNELEPQPDTEGESPWADLWFYTNPIFLKVAKKG
ncbi:phosphoesterase [Novosphingobium sp. TH158]|uniref:phosphoesterase n=1 Tax=Novosphingobium sp. TH158 TaxID=2067455 RepID=UPI001C1F373E|nr:phosphoesterase [Novosphingobium sp. TH158]